eukprot:7128009-Pyramimonas_sp.AAC.2
MLTSYTFRLNCGLHTKPVQRIHENFAFYNHNEALTIPRIITRSHAKHACSFIIAPVVRSRGLWGRLNCADRTDVSRVKRARTQRTRTMAASAVGPLSNDDIERVKHVILLDLDNCMHIFSK